MIDVRKVARQIGAVSGTFLLVTGVALGAELPLFSSGTAVPLLAAPPAALPILVVADVGSPAGGGGPPDGCADLITASADSPTYLTVVYGNMTGNTCNGTFGFANAGPFLTAVPVNGPALALADFDGDTVNDLVVADTLDNVVLLHGDTAIGGFDAPGSPVAVGHSGIVAIAAADVNHNGKMDVVVLNDSGGSAGVTILLGDGQGGLSPGNFVPLASGVSASALTVADFNGDGAPDLAVTNPNVVANSVTILHGDGSGGFSITQTISEGSTLREPVGIAAGDLTGDGRLDLVVVNRNSDDVAVFNGLSGGSFQAPRFFSSGTAASAPDSVILFDANHDGKLDVAVSNNLSSDVSVLLGDGKGNLATPRAFVTDQEPLIVAASDVNSDGIPDLIALNKHTQGAGSDAVVLLGQGDGSFQGVENVSTEPNPNAVVAGDTDNHGVCDLIVPHPGGRVQVIRSSPASGFAAPISLQSHGDGAAVGSGDFNGDGRLDIAVVNRQTDDVSVFLGQPGGLPATPQHNYAIGQGGSAVVVGDWNGDGRPDLAIIRVVPVGNGAVMILLANPDGSFGSPTSQDVGVNPAALDVGDFNKDGKLDLAVANSTSGTVSILLGNGNGTFQAAITLPTSVPNAASLAVGDFDDDGFDDIAVAQAGSQMRAVVLYGSAQGTFTAATTLTNIGTPSAIAARDFTGDMIPDLIILNQVDNTVLSFVSKGAPRGFTAAGSSITLGRLPISVAVGDFDGDGRYDAASADSFAAGTVSVLTNIRAASVLRGDSNKDQKVSAADIVGAIRKLGESSAIRVEQVGKGTYAAGAGADANGDGMVTRQDIFAIAHRLFPRL